MEINNYLVKLIEAAKGMDSVDFFMGKTTLNKTEFRLLREVVSEREKGKGIISSELARRLGITRSAVSQTVTKLEQRNIVKRTPSPYDKKIAYIMLSDYAASTFEQQCRRANAAMESIVAKFGEERLDRFIAELDELCKLFLAAKTEE